MWPLKNLTCCPGVQASVSCTPFGSIRVLGHFHALWLFLELVEIFIIIRKKKKTETDAARRELMAEPSHY